MIKNFERMNLFKDLIITWFGLNGSRDFLGNISYLGL
jgi:hypothetical protein